MDLLKDNISEKHPIRDDERSKSPNVTHRKKVKRFSRELEPGDDTYSVPDSQKFQSEKHGAVCSELMSLEKPEGLVPGSEIQRSRSGMTHTPSTQLQEEKPRETKTDDSEDIVKRFLKLKESTLKEAEVSQEILEQFEHLESLLKTMKLDGKTISCDFPVSTTMDSTRLEDKSDKTDLSLTKGQVMCELASKLGRDDSLNFALYQEFKRGDYERISNSHNPGLELTHIMRKRDLIGPNGAKAFSELGVLTAADILQRRELSSPPSPEPQRPFAFENLIESLERDLDFDDAELIATYCEISNADLSQVKREGAPYLLKVLRETGFLTSTCVRRLREALKFHNLLQACRKVEHYEKQLQLPPFQVKITHKKETKSIQIEQDPEHQRTNNYVEDTFSEMTFATKKEVNSKLKNLNDYLLKKFNIFIEGISKGCIILHIRVSSITNLEHLMQSLRSGEFAKDCAEILFPQEELELHGLQEEIELVASFDNNVIDKIKAVLAKSDHSSLEVHLDAKRTKASICQPTNVQDISDCHDKDSTQSEDDTTFNPREDATRTDAIERPIAPRWNVAVMVGSSGKILGGLEWLFAGFHSLRHQEHRFNLLYIDEETITVAGAGVLPLQAESKNPTIVVKSTSSYNTAFSIQKLKESSGGKYIQRFFHPSERWKIWVFKAAVDNLNDQPSSSRIILGQISSEQGNLITPLYSEDMFEVASDEIGKEKISSGGESEGAETEDVREDEKKELLQNRLHCALQNVFWFPCTEKLALRSLAIQETVQGDMLNFFEEHFTDRGVYMVPPLSDIRLPVKRKSVARMTVEFPVCDKQIEENQFLSKNQKKEILRKRMADRTVYEAAVAIFKWAGDLELNVFIFTNYQYSNYLKNITMATDIDGKFDILVISRDVGVIFIQVSSSMGKSGKVVKQQLQKKTQQLMKDKLVFLESNRDLSDVTSKIPLYQFAFFPNYHRDLLELNTCSFHSQGVLTKECFDRDNIFTTLNEKVLIPPEPCLSVKEYQYLCSRYVGNASNVNNRTAVDGIKTTFKTLKKAFLTQEQRKILKSNDKFVLLAGDYGTGKSLILTQKAVRLAKNTTSKPCLISCTGLQHFGGLKTTFEKNPRGHLKLTKQKLDKLSPTIALFRAQYVDDEKSIQQSVNEMFISMLKDVLAQYTKVVHFLLDDFPFVIIAQNPYILHSLLKIIPDESYLWLSISTVSCTERQVLENVLSNRNVGFNHFTFFHLGRIMRMSQNVVNLYNSVQKFVSGHDVNKTTGHIVAGPKPMLFSLDDCSCKEINETPLTCSCVKSRLIKALRDVMKVTGNIEQGSIAFYLHSFTRTSQIFGLLSEAMESLNHSLKWWFDKESNDTESITVLTEDACWGYESAVVISVDPFSMNHWAAGAGERAIHMSVFSRCLAQYIHVVWPKEEAAEFFEAELKGLEQDLRSNYLKGKNIMKETGLGRNTIKDEGCLDYLKNSDVITTRSQYQSK